MLKNSPKLLALIALLSGSVAQAATWSDTALGWRTGTQFREPFNDKDISKNIFSLTHASGYKYGSNFFNVDFLQSDHNDPAGAGSTNGAHEAYLVYRHNLSLSSVSGKALKFSVVRDIGITAGVDWNSKTDAGYNSKKRMWVFGPTFSFDVPGFLDVGLYGLWESNAPYNTYSNTSTPRYDYKPHIMLSAAYGIPINAISENLKVEGYANFIAAKGNDEFGAKTKPETNIELWAMYDVGAHFGAKGLRAGVGYQYWKNKFGNDHNGPAGSGAFAKTPMFKLDYHF